MTEMNELTYSVRRTPTRRLLRTLALTTGLVVATAVTIIASPFVGATGANAKTPGKTYCYNRVCHRVLTLAQTPRLVGRRTSVIASYYSHCRVDRFNPCGLTSSGARFRPSRADNAASPIYPNGTKLLVWNPATRRAAVIRIDNAGPYWGNRKLDLSRAAASKLGFRKRGVARLYVQVLKAPTRRQARYRRYRTYAPVAGYIGRFASMASALRSTGTPAIAPGRRFAAANVILPVRNTFLAERRIWLARMAEPRPVTVATAATPKIRLPVRLIRTALAPVRSKKRLRRNQRVAALSAKRKRNQISKTAKLKRSRKTPNKFSANSTSKKSGKPSVVRTKSASNKRTLPRQKTPGQSPAPKPKMVWRNGIFGIDPSEA